MNMSLEDPSISLDDPATWDALIGGRRSQSGQKVTHARALTIPPVWQAVSMISGDLAGMPFEPFKRQPELGDSAKTVDKAHLAFRVVRRQANREKSAFEFWRTLFAHALLWQNGYAYLSFHPITGELLEAINLLPDRTAPERRDGKLWYVTEYSCIDGGPPRLKAIPAWQVLHLKGLCIDGLKGSDLVEAMVDTFGLALASRGFQSKFFAHGAKMSGVLMLPSDMDKQARDTVEEGFRQFTEREENWFKVAILRDGAKFASTSVTPQDSQAVETDENNARNVARAFNMQPSRLGVRDASSYNSKAEDNQNYLDTTLSPWMSGIAGECYIKLLTPQQKRDDSHFFEHNTRSLLRMNAYQRHQIYEIGNRIGMYSPNMCLGFENLSPRTDGQGDQYVVSQNTRPANAPEPENQPDPPLPAEPEQNERRTALVKRRLVYAIGDHARQKAAKGPSAFLAWLDGNLESHRERWAAELPGEDQQIVDDIVAGLNFVVSKVTEDKLAFAVGEAMAVFEEKT